MFKNKILVEQPQCMPVSMQIASLPSEKIASSSYPEMGVYGVSMLAFICWTLVAILDKNRIGYY